jgi:phage-related tail protein
MNIRDKLQTIKKNFKKRVKKMQKPKTNAPSQAQQFVSSRSPAFQYFIDVFALAFILSVLLTIITRVWK